MSEISVVVVGSTSINSVVGNGDTVNVNVGNQTIGGGNGAAATIEAGSVTTIDATQTATVTNVGTAYAAKFNFSLPRGLTGSTGPANSLSIGSVSTGTTAAVSISGSAPSQALSFVLQPGPTGPANSLSIGSVSTGTTAAVSISGSAPSQALAFVLPQGPAGPVSSLKIGTVVTGADAAATITGTAPTQTLNLVLPQGATGIQGPQGSVGPTGPANSLTVGSVTTTTATTASVSITGSAPSQQISFVIPQGPQGPQGAGGPFTTVQAGTVTTGAAGTSAKIDTVSSGGTVTLNFTIPRGVDGTANLADETPQPLGVASAGSAGFAARADHVHAVPTISYANLSGVPTTFAPAAHTQAISTVTGLQDALDGKQASGSYATLVGGQVPSSQLPSFVDDVIDVGGTLPVSGDVGKIYVVSTGGSANKIYRWSGSTFIEISPSPGSTDSVTEGSTNLYHTTARAAAAAPVQNVAGRTGTITLTKSDVGLDNVPNTDATARANHTGTQAASTISDFATEAAKYGPVTSVSGRTGTVTVAQLGTSGTASSTTFLRGDGAWSTAGLGADDDIDGGWIYGTSGLSRSITITSPPTNQTAISGAATFGVTAVAEPTGTLSYQWQKSDSAGFAATQRTLPASANWSQVAYGGGTFVAVAFGSAIAATSADGITWTQRTLPAAANWRSVTYGGDTFVAVAYISGIGATSADGITWTQRTLPTNAYWQSVTYGNGTFVAVAELSSIAATSPDGITWTQRTLPVSAGWVSVTFGGGTFVAIADTGGFAATSTDGITWTQRTLPASAGWFVLAYGNGTFVALSVSSIAATSTDGITWTQRTLPASTQWTSVAYGGGSFVAVAANGSIAATSPDGITWTQRTLPVSAVWRSVTFGNGTFAAIAYNSSIAATITLSGQSDFANVSGATSSTLALTGLTNAADNADRFRVIVSAASASSVTSQPATLTVS